MASRDTVTQSIDTDFSRCEGCPAATEGEGVNPDCEANRSQRGRVGLSTEACGLILRQYSYDDVAESVYSDGTITITSRRTLRRIDVTPITGVWDVYEAASMDGQLELVIDLEHEVEYPSGHLAS